MATSVLQKKCFFLQIIRKSCLLNSKITPNLLNKRLMSQWHIKGSMCLERKPVISQEMNLLETKYWAMLQKMELEGSLLSDHELRHNEDIARAEKLKSEESDIVDLDAALKQTAQDAEDTYTEELNKFSPASRTIVDNSNKKSLERHLDKSLLLVIKKKLGNDFQWVLPESICNENETLRQTCERVCKEVCGDTTEVQFLGNAPVGYYKYKYPKAAREKGIFGAKIFFLKAQLKSGALYQTSINDYMWLTRAELKEHLQKDYCKSIETFLTMDEESPIFENVKESNEMLPLKSEARA